MTRLLPISWHPALLASLVLLVGAYAWWARAGAIRTTPRQHHFAAAAAAALFAAYWWPLGDLAAHVSLAALVLQRLVVILCVAPLLLVSLPVELVERITRPRLLDRLSVACSKPVVAIVVVTAVGTASLTPAAVDWSVATPGASALLAVVNLGVGIVLWLPVLAVIPAARRVGNVGKGAYVLIASLVVTVFSIVWIFARHPLYAAFHHQRLVLGISPLLDQQLAGFVAKLGAYVPMWTIAFVLLARSADGDHEEPLRWSDVQRELERSERRGRVVDVG